MNGSRAKILKKEIKMIGKSLGGFKSQAPVNTRKVIVVEANPVHGYPTETDPPEWFIVLTDPAPRKFVCSGSTRAEAIERAEDMGFSFEENPEPFPADYLSPA